MEDSSSQGLRVELLSLSGDAPSRIQMAAAIGFTLGLLIWGAIFLSMISGVQSFFGDDSSSLTSEVLVEQVEAPLASPTQTSPAPTTTTEPTDENRFNCNRIRGTDYRSEEERVWFRAGCLTPTP